MTLRSFATAATLAMAVALAVTGTAGAQPSAGGATLILTGGKIRTPAGWAEAMAVAGDRILAVGTAAEMARYRAAGTETVDLTGQVVLPGFHDLHVHPLFGGLTQSGLRKNECRFAQGSTLEQVRAALKACVARVEPGQWIIGGQWDASTLGDVPDRRMIDDITPDNPVLINDTSGHSAWANSRALEAAGLTAASKDPEGGIVERRADGEPTGVLRELAIALVGNLVPPPNHEEVRASLEWALAQMLSYGITSFTEASVGFTAGTMTEVETYAALADAGILKHRAQLCLTWAPGALDFEAALAKRKQFERERLSIDCVKIFLDGVPTDSHTAAMIEPYADVAPGRHSHAVSRGLLLVLPEVVNKAVTRFDAMGLTVKFHAAGDAAVRAGLDAIAAARKANGMGGANHNVGHCTFVHPDDIARAIPIRATFEVSPYLWSPSPINDDITKAVGSPRIERAWPVRDLLEGGAMVVPGSDWSVVPSVNPWPAVEALVTRQVPGGGDRAFGKDQAVTLAQAFDLFTVNSARQLGREAEIGTLEAGKLADFVVVDRDPFGGPVTDIHKTRVRMTFIAGERVFEAGAAN